MITIAASIGTQANSEPGWVSNPRTAHEPARNIRGCEGGLVRSLQMTAMPVSRKAMAGPSAYERVTVATTRGLQPYRIRVSLRVAAATDGRSNARIASRVAAYQVATNAALAKRSGKAA